MTNTAKVIIGFAVLTVVGCGIIGYGLYRKVRPTAGQDGGALADKAEALTQMTVTEFARESATVQEEILRDAEATLEAAQNQKGFHREVREDLSSWIKTQEKLREAARKKKQRLEELTAGLAHAFPKEAEMQLAPNDVKRLRQALGAARGPDSELTATVSSRKVNIAHACRDEAEELALRADQVERELSKRERLFKAFVLKAQRADKDAQTRRADYLHKEIEKTWSRCAGPDYQKKRIVDDLYARLGNLAGRPKRQTAAEQSLKQSIQQVAKARNREELNKVRPGFETAVKGAQEYEALKPLVAMTRRALAVAEERTLPGPKRSAEQLKKDKKWQLTMAIGKKVLELPAIKGKTPKEIQDLRKEKWQEIQTQVAELEKVDDVYAKALAKLLNLRQVEMNRPPKKPAPEARTRFLLPPWTRLKRQNKKLVDAMQALGKIRGIVKEAPVRLKLKYKTTVPDPVEAKRKQAVLRQLDTWIYARLKKQKDDVHAMSKKNTP